MTPAEALAFKQLQDQVTRLNAIVAGNGNFPVIAGPTNMAALAKATGLTSLQPGKLYLLTGEATLAYLGYQGNNAYLGLAQMQQGIASLAAEVDNLELHGDVIETSRELGELRNRFDALSAGISALDDMLESRGAGDGDTDPKVTQ